MARRRRYRSPTKGRKCVRRKRVRVKGQGMAWRCAKYGPKRGGGRRRKSRRRSSSRRYRSRVPRGMARRGSKCVRMKRVRLRRKIGGRRYVQRCAKYRAR